MSAIWQSIHAVRAKRLVIVKRNENTGTRSKYADIADMFCVLGPALDEHQLAVACEPGKIRVEADMLIQSMVISVTMAGENERVEVPVEQIFPGDIVSKNTGGSVVNVSMRQGQAQTYGARYHIGRFFNCIFGDDDDARNLSRSTLPATTATEPTPGAHWSQFCQAFDVGTEESKQAWQIMRDPSDETGQRQLDEYNDARMTTLWKHFPTDPALNAWLAELVAYRASKKNLVGWEAVRNAVPGTWPVQFKDCTGEQLKALALAPALKE